MERILLASASPRRAWLLKQAGLPFRTITPKIDETWDLEQQVDDRVRQLAERKVRAGMARAGRLRWVIGCDTLVEISGRIMGKPKDQADAVEMLSALSGRIHRVHTGIALYVVQKEHLEIKNAVTEVHFRKLKHEENVRYAATNEWHEAAGAYRIQERGETLVDGIRGSYSNIVGLPLSLLCGMLSANRYPFA